VASIVVAHSNWSGESIYNTGLRESHHEGFTSTAKAGRCLHSLGWLLVAIDITSCHIYCRPHQKVKKYYFRRKYDILRPKEEVTAGK
jgi:hypothetical protein